MFKGLFVNNHKAFLQTCKNHVSFLVRIYEVVCYRFLSKEHVPDLLFPHSWLQNKTKHLDIVFQ